MDSDDVMARGTLERAILCMRPAESIIRQRLHQVQMELLKRSENLRVTNFTAISSKDLDLLFQAYDEHFLTRLCGTALKGRALRFRLSRRMTRAGGMTTRFINSDGEETYEIAVAIDMLFNCFRENDRIITVCGIRCENRLEGLQRIFEHEVVHLIEMLCWRDSDCSAPRFQDISARLFLHRAHTHALITRIERAAQSGIRVGSHVAFIVDGRRQTGRVNRITKHATVLVADAEGRLYSDGSRYKTYYVPLLNLAVIDRASLEVKP